MNDSWVDYAAIGRRIRARRTALGLTQGALAARVGVSASFVGHLERAEKIPSIETLARLCACLSVSMDALVLGRQQACDRENCALYGDLRRLLAAYSASSPREWE